jgi:hypothetical protein
MYNERGIVLKQIALKLRRIKKSIIMDVKVTYWFSALKKTILLKSTSKNHAQKGKNTLWF